MNKDISLEELANLYMNFQVDNEFDEKLIKDKILRDSFQNESVLLQTDNKELYEETCFLLENANNVGITKIECQPKKQKFNNITVQSFRNKYIIIVEVTDLHSLLTK